MSMYDFNIQYYISTGRLGVMYTLRYKAIEIYPNGDGTFKERELNVYLCTLSKDPDEALQKAKDYLSDLGIDYKKYNLSTDFVLNERAESIYGQAEERRGQIANQVLVSGKYEGMHVSELPEDYLKWCHLNLYSGVNHEIIESYIEENDLHNEWVKLGVLKIYNKLIDFKNQFQTNIDNCILVFGGDAKVQKPFNKSGTVNQRTLDFMKTYSKSNRLIEYKDAFTDIDDEEKIIKSIDLVKVIAISKFNFKRYDFMNKVVCRTWINKMRNFEYLYLLKDFTYDDVFNTINESESYQLEAIRNS